MYILGIGSIYLQSWPFYNSPYFKPMFKLAHLIPPPLLNSNMSLLLFCPIIIHCAHLKKDVGQRGGGFYNFKLQLSNGSYGSL